ncbi:BQ5605_C051g12547 [Microbotryum silenes-dioicae]|uniref:BQ5605_C051g12547 protein n=1 Tax=Microbotryum silenes-dioicae TaxID=796604 RepID=A0A2X0MNZ5_9BASI|nr:BQ5605_C051g12547 [Microbotryum silenes-dioicae]
MPRSQGRQGGPSQPRQVLGARVAPYHGLPWACSSARCWAPRGSTLLFPHVSIRNDLGPQTAVCTHCKARHWELGPPVFRVFGRLYHRLGALIPAVNQCPAFAQTWLIDPAEATDTRLGPDGADSRMQRSTLTKLESILRTGNRFPGPTHPQPSYVEHGNDDAYLRFRHQHGRSWTSRPYSLARSIRLPCLSGSHYYFLQGKMGPTPTFLFAGFAKLGCQSPETESRSAKVSNRGRYMPVSVLLTKAKRRTKTDNEDEDGGGQRECVPSWKNLHLTTTQGINGLTPNQIGRSMTLGSTFKNRPRDIAWQRYQDAMACVVKHGKPPLLITMMYDPKAPEIKAALGLNDKACNRPDLIAQVFEAKSGNKRHAGCFSDECRMNGFVSLLYFVGCFLNLCAEIM